MRPKMTKKEINTHFWSAFKLVGVGVALVGLAALLAAFAYFSPVILASMFGLSLVIGLPLIAIVGIVAGTAAFVAPLVAIAGLGIALVNAVRTFMWAFEKPTTESTINPLAKLENTDVLPSAPSITITPPSPKTTLSNQSLQQTLNQTPKSPILSHTMFANRDGEVTDHDKNNNSTNSTARSATP
jgi:hypothetical protein